MNNQDAFERILASLYDAMLDETRWPATSALIDEACGLTGNGLMVAEGPKNDVRGLFVGLYYRGQRREDLEREYLENYYSIDERIPRFRQLSQSSRDGHPKFPPDFAGIAARREEPTSSVFRQSRTWVCLAWSVHSGGGRYRIT